VRFFGCAAQAQIAQAKQWLENRVTGAPTISKRWHEIIKASLTYINPLIDRAVSLNQPQPHAEAGIEVRDFEDGDSLEAIHTTT